jgi:hypothetical protein
MQPEEGQPMTKLTKIHFHLEQDEDDYPPAAVESVWATSGGRDNEFVVDNIPFFIRDATIGDCIEANEEDGALWFKTVIRPSGNTLLRVIFFAEEQTQEITQQLISFGCTAEYASNYRLLAVSVPAHVELSVIRDYLDREAALGRLDYEEPLIRR